MTIAIEGITHVDSNEAADMLGLTTGTLRNALSERRIKLPNVVRLGGKAWYPLADVQAEARRRGR